MDPSTDDRHDAFLRLFTAAEPALRAFVRALVPTLADADDVMQEVAVVLWSKFAGYDSSRPFRGWAFGIAKLEVLGWQRDRARDRHVFGSEITQLIAVEIEERSDRLAAQRRALEACLERLPAAQRQLVRAAYAPGTRINDVAGSLQESVAAIYKRLHRIRLSLVECTRRQIAAEGWS
jgi:RNA polymerase sigma-70 factor (ECF subfamily)